MRVPDTLRYMSTIHPYALRVPDTLHYANTDAMRVPYTLSYAITYTLRYASTGQGIAPVLDSSCPG